MRLVGILACLLAVTVPHAIVTRHDVDARAGDAEAARYSAVCKILPDGEGVLVGPDRVLTAAHVGTGFPRERLRVVFAGIEYAVADVAAPENWRPGDRDVAVLRLTNPVRGVEPLEVELDALPAVGDPITLVGRGDHGDGRRGVAGNDGALRIASNALTAVGDGRLEVRLDAPGEGALADEGVSGPGDSGTPALVERDGRLVVVGIGSVGRNPPGGRYGEYGSLDVFIALVPLRDWLRGRL